MRVEHLIADTFGTHIGKYSQRLKITQGGKALTQAPLMFLRSVTIMNRGVSISADALEACAEQGIPVFFLDSRGRPYAAIYAAGLTGTVKTRRAQFEAYHDQRGAQFALAVAEGKIQNQATTLKYLAKTRKEKAPTMHQELMLSAGEVLDCISILDALVCSRVEDLRPQIMGAEGNAARRYWSAVNSIIPEHYHWPGREGRGANDAINSLLNYGYEILYGLIEQAVILAGLDPYAGFIHADRPGKPSLVLDFIEEFRQVAVDRVVFGLATRNFNVEQDEKGRLSLKTRRTLAQKVLDRQETPVRYERKKYPIRFVIQNQARHLATFLRGEREAYNPFKASW